MEIKLSAPSFSNRLSAPLWTANSILRARARQHAVKDFAGPLSIKSVQRGIVDWKTGQQTLRVYENSFLVLNSNEPYTLEIDSREPVETCCVFFQNGWIESLFGSLTHADDVEGANTRSLTFISRLHTRDERVLPRMEMLSKQTEADPLWLDEQFLGMAQHLLLLFRDAQRQIRRCPAARAATRVELFRRVCRGREYLHAHVADKVTLVSCARAACLSPYHFQRTFQATFGRSPHAYLTELRLERAAHLLRTSNTSVTDISSAVGFESPTSFAALFRRRFGASPSAVKGCEI